MLPNDYGNQTPAFVFAPFTVGHVNDEVVFFNVSLCGQSPN